MIIATLVSAVRTTTRPIITFQTHEIIQDGKYAGMRKMYAQYVTTDADFSEVCKSLGKTYTCEVSGRNLINFKYVDGLKLTPIPQSLPAWIVNYAIDKPVKLDGFWYDQDAVQYYKNK